MAFFRRETEDYLPRSGLLSPSVSGGYTYSPSTGIVPTVAPPAPAKNQQSLADYLNTYSNLNTVDWGSIGPALEKLGIGQNGRDGSAGWQFNNNSDAGDIGWKLTPEAAGKLQGWTVGDPRLQGDTRTQQIRDASGAGVGTSQEDVSLNFMDTLAPLLVAGGAAFFGVPAIGGALGGGLLGGAAAGAGLGAATAAAQGNDIGKGLLMGGIGGGISGYMGGVPDTTSAATQSAGNAAGAITNDAQGAIDAYLQANPVQMGDLLHGMPDIESIMAGAGGVDSAPTPSAPNVPAPQDVATPAQYRPSVDSQQYSTDAGITGADAAKAATVPKTVNLPGNGGTMATSGGIQGAADLAAQTLRDATASPDIGGGLLSQAGGFGADVINKVGGAAGSAGSWAAQNPILAKLLLGGAGALLSTQGNGSSGGGAAPRQYGPPVQWKSPVQGISQGLLSGVQSGGQSSQYPAAMGLLGGQPNSGAWRFLG